MRNALAVASALLLVSVVEVSANIDYEFEKLANEGQFASIYNRCVERGFDSLDGMQKCVFVAAAHLANHNEQGYALRKKLTQAHWDEVDHWMPDPDITHMGIGEALLYAQIDEIRGDYPEAKQYLKRGMNEVARVADRLKYYQDNDLEYDEQELLTAVQLEKALFGLYGAVGLLAIEEARSGRPDYALVAEQMRLIKEIEESAHKLGLDSLLPSPSDSTAPASSDDTSEAAHMADAIVHEATKSRLYYLDSLFNLSWASIAFQEYHWGNLLIRLEREEDAREHYFDANLHDEECVLYWNAYLDHETRKDMLKFRAENRLKMAKENKDDSLSLFIANDCMLAIGQSDKVISEASKYLKNHPTSSRALTQRSRGYLAKKDYAKALQDAQAAVTNDAENYEGWFAFGQAAQSANDPKAKEYFGKAYQLSPPGLKIHTAAQAAMQ